MIIIFCTCNTVKSRKRAYGTCAGCKSEGCGKCGSCLDIKKFGGPGRKKQKCNGRKCVNAHSLGNFILHDRYIIIIIV